MKLAIMQPYFFPYLGYWQLMSTVDKFVIYNDVNYIKGGWINRNRILINQKPSYITIPLIKASQNKKILEISIQNNNQWKVKMLKSISNAYRQSTFFDSVYPLIEDIINYDTDSLSGYLSNQLRSIAYFMGIDTEISYSYNNYDNTNLKGQERIVDICQQVDASHYYNLAGGVSLYDKNIFKNKEIDLLFIEMHDGARYKQHSDNFIPYLSIIDLLMEVEQTKLSKYLNNYNLIEKI